MTSLGAFEASQSFSFIEMPLRIYDLAGQLKQVSKSLKTPDALHIAVGHLIGAEEIWTMDRELVSKYQLGVLTTTPVCFPYS